LIGRGPKLRPVRPHSRQDWPGRRRRPRVLPRRSCVPDSSAARARRRKPCAPARTRARAHRQLWPRTAFNLLDARGRAMSHLDVRVFHRGAQRLECNSAPGQELARCTASRFVNSSWPSMPDELAQGFSVRISGRELANKCQQAVGCPWRCQRSSAAPRRPSFRRPKTAAPVQRAPAMPESATKHGDLPA